MGRNYRKKVKHPQVEELKFQAGFVNVVGSSTSQQNIEVGLVIENKTPNGNLYTSVYVS